MVRSAEGRARFIVRAYLHLLGAVLAVVGLEVFLFRSGLAEPMARRMLGTSWLLVLGAFLVVGWLGRRFAYRTRSLAGQYFGLITYVVAKAIILVPMLYLAEQVAPGAIASASAVTIAGFAGLTAVAFTSRRDFTFLRAGLRWAGLLAFGLILGALVLDFRLGTWFDLGMIALAGGGILYDTSKIVRRYRSERYVAAALSLFASAAMMFWYALRAVRRLAPR